MSELLKEVITSPVPLVMRGLLSDDTRHSIESELDCNRKLAAAALEAGGLGVETGARVIVKPHNEAEFRALSLNRGFSVVDADRFSPTTAVLRQGINDTIWPDGVISTGAYASRQNQAVLRRHFDVDPVIALQIVGTKRFKFYATRTDQIPNEYAELSPNDGLFIPRGVWHDALTVSEASLHLCIDFMPSNWESRFAHLPTS